MERIKRMILAVAHSSRLIRRTASFIAANTLKDSYAYLREKFLSNGQNSVVDESMRAEIVNRFERIDRGVRPIGITPADGLFLAELLLNMDGHGDIIECGCYAGGSSAKLSIISQILGRRLIIFDSFEGLPVAEQHYMRDHHCRRTDIWAGSWQVGEYAARLDEVQSNIKRYGELSVCSFVKGWFSEILTNENLPPHVAFAFAAVDLANSVRDCFVAIWPSVSDKGVCTLRITLPT